MFRGDDEKKSLVPPSLNEIRGKPKGVFFDLHVCFLFEEERKKETMLILCIPQAGKIFF